MREQNFDMLCNAASLYAFFKVNLTPREES
jgi:hypothetical protein